jgi:hypothetical protein
MPRSRLPNRRPNTTVAATWPPGGDNPLNVCLGFDAQAHVKEVFARAGRPHTDIDNIADDSAILVSLCLQAGLTLGEIRHSLSRLPTGEPASIVGFIVDIARRTEVELQGPCLVDTAERAP